MLIVATLGLVHSSFPPPSLLQGPRECPITESKPNFNIDQFMGKWYIQEYQYPRETSVSDFSCTALTFSKGADGILGNFTFRFPPRYGFFHSVSAMSTVIANGQDGLWMTEFKGAELLTAVVDTDYSHWAIYVQCMAEEGGNRFSSTRVLSRFPTLEPQHWLLVRDTISRFELDADFVYTIDQENCRPGI